MTATNLSIITNKSMSTVYPLIDTHTHFDDTVFDCDRALEAQRAYEKGVRHFVLVGYLHRHFERLNETEQLLNNLSQTAEFESDEQKKQPKAHVALGLHPFYIDQHTETHLADMAQMVSDSRPLAIGEIGLDTFTDAMKVPEVFAKQERFFTAQLDLAVRHQLPVMLHIRKAHAEALAILKAHEYNASQLGGIAHSFSGGEQEAKAFVKLGFKLGVTGQVTNPNAKKLRRAIQAAVESYGIGCLVIETDCPDMMPIMCQSSGDSQSSRENDIDNRWHDKSSQSQPDHKRNVPANLPWVLATLSELLEVPTAELAEQLWKNSCDALQADWVYEE
ncbi:TatD family hydrolase [Psychrobacter sp.]|uniref:TatD family hydrolase n=1 Tax=Psychrobacter sp. TaxID=56811 RepID=UPI00264A0DB6|nr:TatD family hydrolase [Psychrobacter sp.]MDN6276736.1 TatD family hydrolase [Psychrobacter sp.]MDN6308941.1 TatD family hydrolase [Psychrobacter sp.]